MWPRDEARAFFAGRGEPLKVQLIEEKTEGQSEVSCYTIKDKDTFIDFCVGPHVPSTGRLKAFKLLNTSNAYWKGDAHNQPMQRIYGTAFFSEKELKDHLTQIEEAKKRDHRKLGRDLGLFTFHQWAPGAAFWLDKGTTLYNGLANYMRGVLFPAGYVEVKTPLIFNKALWETSGHWCALSPEHVHHRPEGRQCNPRWRAPTPTDGHEGDELSRPHAGVRQRGSQLSRPAAAPARADAAAPQRGLGRAVGPDPRPPVLAGRCPLLRDAGADCRRSRTAAGPGAARVWRLRAAVLGEAVDPPAEFLGEVETWDSAEAQLKTALEKAGQAYTINEGDGAFYGPKIDFDVTDAIGRKWQCATIQLDYQIPQRFGLKYIGADNAEHRPVVIHRAIFGSFERFIAILIEHYAGAFPLWLAPVQAMVAAHRRPALDYARSVEADLSRSRACGRCSTTVRKRLDIRFVRPSCRRFLTCWSWATGKRPKGRFR